jgi:hypothetical protein
LAGVILVIILEGDAFVQKKTDNGYKRKRYDSGIKIPNMHFICKKIKQY